MEAKRGYKPSTHNHLGALSHIFGGKLLIWILAKVNDLGAYTAAADSLADSATRWPSAVERYEGWLTKLSVSSWWIFKNWRRRYLVVGAGFASAAETA